ALTIRRRNRRCQSCEVIGKKVPIRVGSNRGGMDVVWRCADVRSGVWRRRVRTEKQARNQAEASDAAGKIRTAKIKSTPIKRLRVTGNVAVATVNSSPIVGIGNDHDIGLVIPGAGNHPRLHLARVIGGAQVCVPNTAADLETTEFVSQKDVDYTCHRIAAIKS